MTELPVTTFNVPPFCFRSIQQDWPTLVALLRVPLGDFSGVNVGNTPPAAADRDKPWWRSNADGTPDDWYGFANGSWLAKAKLPAPGVITMWAGAEPDIVTLDGGEAGAISATTGAFWEKFSAMDAKFPFGPGTYGATTVAVGQTGGAHEVTLDSDQMPPHDHGLLNLRVVHETVPAGTLEAASGNGYSTKVFQSEGGRPNGTTKAHDNMPPFYGIYFIRRTARLYHRA